MEGELALIYALLNIYKKEINLQCATEESFSKHFLSSAGYAFSWSKAGPKTIPKTITPLYQQIRLMPWPKKLK